jgi:hypothetical protein
VSARSVHAEREVRPPTLAALVAYFLRLGTLGFGGPIALVGYMHRDLVERRGWFDKAEYVEGLALAQLAPGPLAAQLAIYFGWLRAGTWGATAVAIAFVLPSFVMGAGGVRALRRLRRAAVDARCLLRRGCGRHRDHRTQRLEARPLDARTRPPAVGDRSGERARDRGDRIRAGLAVRPRRCAAASWSTSAG